jgi:hypothetical protein
MNMKRHPSDDRNDRRPPRRSRGTPLTEAEVRQAIVTVLNKRTNGDKSCPTVREVWMETGGSMRDVSKFMRRIRGPKFVRVDDLDPETGNSTPTVLGSDRPSTIGLSDEDADALPPAEDDSLDDEELHE